MNPIMAWQPIETAPKDREILLLGTGERGEELIAYGEHRITYTERWNDVVATEDEIHRVRQRTPHEVWWSEPELWPTHWADIKRPDA